MIEIYPFVGLVICIVAILYFILPAKVTGEKNKHVGYVLADLTLAWIVCLLQRVMMPQEPHIGYLLALIFVPFSAIIYLIYPFKGQRNKTVAFLLTTTAAIEVLAVGAAWTLVQNSNM